MKLQTTLCALLFGATAALGACESESDEAELAPKATQGELTEMPEADPDVVGYTLIEVREIDIPETEQQIAAQAGNQQAGNQKKAGDQKAATQMKAGQKDTRVKLDESATGAANAGDRTVAKGVQAVGADTRTPSAAAPMSDPTFESASKITGGKKIPLADDAKQIMDATDLQEFTMRVKVCIDSSGTPTSVMLVDPSPYEVHNEKVKQSIMGWRYQAATVNGEPVPSCKRLEFAYQIEDLGKTRPILYDQQAPHGENRPESQGIHQP